MSQLAVEKMRGSTTAYPGSYDSTKVNLSSLMTQSSSGGVGNFVGPVPCGIGRVVEDMSMPPIAPAVWNWSSSIDWTFFCNFNASTTNKIGLYETNRTTGVMTFRGYITATFPPTGSQTIRGMKVAVYKHTEGTVAVSGTAVTGTSTTWSADRLAAGARIGFGSTDPTQITTWYYLSSIGSDTSITLTGSAGTVAGGTSYVIEELRIALCTTNGTATNGGLFLIKGLNRDAFTGGGTTISAATSTDNVRAVYWLADASTVTNTTAAGLAFSPTSQSNTNHTLFVLNGGNSTSAGIYQYNTRASLTVSSGKDTTSLVLKTGTQFVTGSIQLAGAGLVFANASHGAGSGVACLYVLTASRLYRATESSITASSTTFLADNMSFGGPANLLLPTLSSAQTIDYDPVLDRFVIGSNSGSSMPCLATKYDTATSLVDSVWPLIGFFSQQSSLSSTNATHPVLACYSSVGYWVAASQGMIYLCAATSTSDKGYIVVFPGGADWSNTAFSKQFVITPSISTSGCTKFNNSFINCARNIADASWGWETEPFNIYVRVSGISDDSGAWTLLGSDGDLSGIGAASAIQFKFEFRTMSKSCIPARIHSISVSYENSAYLPSWLEWNSNDDNFADGSVGFTQLSTNGSVPNFQIDYFREDTDANVLSQQSTGTTNGVFEYWNGSAWTAGTGTDTAGLRRRFRPTAGLPSAINLYQKISTF